MQTSLFLNLVSLEKHTWGKNTQHNSNVAQYAKVSKNVSVSAYQRLGLGLVSDPKSNVSVSVSISWKVGRSRSRSRLGLKVKRLGLVSVSDLNVSFTSLDWGNPAEGTPKEDLVGLCQNGYGGFWHIPWECSQRDHWRLKIKGKTGWLRFTCKIGIKMVCAHTYSYHQP